MVSIAGALAGLGGGGILTLVMVRILEMALSLGLLTLILQLLQPRRTVQFLSKRSS